MDMFVALALSLVLAQAAEDPRVAFGRTALAPVLRSAGGLECSVGLAPALGREGYRIRFEGGRAVIEGGDASGAMYGFLELAERVAARGRDAWTGVIEGRPYLAERGLNLFLTLPWDEDRNEPVYDPAALTDPERWWFQD